VNGFDPQPVGRAFHLETNQVVRQEDAPEFLLHACELLQRMDSSRSSISAFNSSYPNSSSHRSWYSATISEAGNSTGSIMEVMTTCGGNPFLSYLATRAMNVFGNDGSNARACAEMSSSTRSG
jgi:hypothetical protein